MEPAGFLNLNIYSAFARHCTASSRTMRMAVRGATPCVIRSSTAGGVNRLSCSQLPPNTLGLMSACVMRSRPAVPRPGCAPAKPLQVMKYCAR